MKRHRPRALHRRTHRHGTRRRRRTPACHHGVGRDQVPTIDAGHSFTGWGPLHAALRTEAATYRGISVHTGVTVHGAIDAPGGGAIVQSSDGNHTADLVVGADGYNSVVRRAVAPIDLLRLRPLARTHRRVHPPARLRPTRRPRHRERSRRCPRHFRNPRRRRGRPPRATSRRLHLVRRVPQRRARRRGRLEQPHVRGTWHGQNIPTDTVKELRERARAWSSSWRDAIAESIDDRRFIGTPVAEFLPPGLPPAQLSPSAMQRTWSALLTEPVSTAPCSACKRLPRRSLRRAAFPKHWGGTAARGYLLPERSSRSHERGVNTSRRAATSGSRCPSETAAVTSRSR